MENKEKKNKGEKKESINVTKFDIENMSKDDVVDVPDVIGGILVDYSVKKNKEIFGDKAYNPDKTVILLHFENKNYNVKVSSRINYYKNPNNNTKLGKYINRYEEIKVGQEVILKKNKDDHYEVLI